MISFAERMEKIFDFAFLDKPAKAFDSKSNNRNGGSNKSAAATNNKTKCLNTVTTTVLPVMDANENLTNDNRHWNNYNDDDVICGVR